MEKNRVTFDTFGGAGSGFGTDPVSYNFKLQESHKKTDLILEKDQEMQFHL